MSLGRSATLTRWLKGATVTNEKKALQAIIRARQVLAAEHPFFAVLALSMKPHARDAAWPVWPRFQGEVNATMATDGADLFFCPDWVLSVTAPELRGVVAHEAMHLANLHHTRRGLRDPAVWNMATDAVINRDLLRAGFVLPAGGVNLTGPDPYAGMNAEQAYAKMVRDGVKPGKPAPGGVMDAAPDGDDAKMAESEVRAQLLVRQAVMVSKAQSGPADLGVIARLVGELNAPRRSWRDVVREFAANSSNRDYSWSRPNRRQMAFGLIAPSFRAVQPAHVVCAIDSSGSMDDAAVTAGIGEVQQMLDEGACDRVTLIWCDSAVRGVQEFEAGDVIKADPKGGGGTRFSPVFAWVAKNCEDCSGLIYITDMGSRDFGASPDYPVVWARYGSQDVAPFGDHCDIDPHA